jgi:hypothetical protein
MLEEKSNLEMICKNVEAKDFKIEMVDEINYVSKDTTSFIEITFQNSTFNNNENTDKSYLASYCAIQAYQLFNPKIWNGKDGISVVFKNENIKNETKQYYELKDLKNIKRIITNFDSFIESLETAKNSNHLNNIDRLEIEDSVKIASYFTENLFEENTNLVNVILESYKLYEADLDKADRKYFYNTLTKSDTVGSKITNSDFYQLKSTYILPISYSICRMECIVNKDNLDKFVAIQMNTKEE